MNDKFADWYRIVTTGTEQALAPDLLERRWSGLEGFLEELIAGDMVDLARLLLATRLDSNLLLQKLKTSFKATDAAFPLKDNNLELRVLAGSALAVRFEDGADPGTDAAALALHVGRYGQGPAEAWLEPFLCEAETYLKSRCAALRAVPSVEVPDSDLSRVHEAIDQLVESFAANDLSGRVAPAAKQAFPLLLEAMKRLALKMSAATAALVDQARLRREESDILWWMTSAYSRDLDQSMTAVPAPAVCLVAGKELADLVEPPGPLPARSFLDRVLLSAGKPYQKPVSLAAAVNAAPAHWREQFVGQEGVNEVLDLCPVLAAAKASLAQDDPAGWYPVVCKSHRVEPEAAGGAVDLALQVYRECLLTRASMLGRGA